AIVTPPLHDALPISVVSCGDGAQFAVSLARQRVAAEAAVLADRRRRGQIPFARVVLLECFVRKDAGGTDLGEVSAEFIFKGAVLDRKSTRLNSSHVK